VRPYWWHLAGIALLSLLSAPLALLLPVPLKLAVDSVIGADPVPDFLAPLVPGVATSPGTNVLLLAVGMLVLVALLQHLQGFGRWLLELYVGEKMVLAFRGRLFASVQRLSLAFHDARGTTDSLYRIQYDATGIQNVPIKGMVPMVTALVTLLALIAVTVQIDVTLGLIALAVAPLLFLWTEVYRHRLRRGWKQIKAMESSAMSIAQEVLATLRVVKAFGQEERERDRFLRQSEKSMRHQIRVVFTETVFGVLVGLTIAIGTASALYVGVGRVQAGVISVGELLLVMAYLAQLYQPLQTLSKKLTEMQSALASAERAYALLDERPDVKERPGAGTLDRARGAVELSGVDFWYEEGREVLRNVSCRIRAGTSVGIAGRTGAGKTTLVSLLPRFLDPTSGAIHLDGVDLRDYKLADLRRQFAVVLQEPVLFSTTLAENIGYGRPAASQKDIVAAACAAGIHDFIADLPDGYDTEVGERGMRLSGGERQRIALARAFLKDAPLLILDEPTSAIDTSSETAILQTMQKLMRGRTTFMIAHRPHTLASCDVVLELADGQLLHQGSREPIDPVRPLMPRRDTATQPPPTKAS
jgi:ATP-binding cassette subfamily B protein